jgi:superfamily II DNA helicase RecQ
MSQLGWYTRQIRAQTVWLTATLLPVIQEEFIQHNKLVKPRIIRESTNWPSIKYIVSRETRPGTLAERAAHLVQASWPQSETFDRVRDKIIIYCQTRTAVSLLAKSLGCLSYTSKSGTEEAKAAILSSWITDKGQPVIVATSALGVGFDYPHVR